MEHKHRRLTQDRNKQAIELSNSRREYLKDLKKIQDPKLAAKLKALKDKQRAEEPEDPEEESSSDEVLGLSLDEDIEEV